MKRSALYILLSLILTWLPIAQASAMCCLKAMPTPSSHMQDKMSHCGDEPSAELGQHEADDGSCISTCAALGHPPVPTFVLSHSLFAPDEMPIVELPALLLESHQEPPLRPPQTATLS